MLITAPPGTPEAMEAKATALEQRAAEADGDGRPLTAAHFRAQAVAIRAHAAELRGRRTDGVRFG